jgi:hypothetical protein
MATTFGTCHFVSLHMARCYYAPYSGWQAKWNSKSTIENVSRKLRDGEIKIGPPLLKPGDSLAIDQSEGRYLITSK